MVSRLEELEASRLSPPTWCGRSSLKGQPLCHQLNALGAGPALRKSQKE